MLKPAPITSFPRHPITALVSVAALGVTSAWWAGWDIQGITMNGYVWAHWQLWRALTSCLPHVGVWHLAFNLYWFWVFGTLIEHTYGHLKLAGIIVLLAFASGLAEFALLGGGVGLSGVGYGFWAMLYVLERKDPRFADAVDRRTSQTFIGWFFLCIILTITNVMAVANIAHAVGAGLGALLGLVATSRGAARQKTIAAIVGILVLCVTGATIFWPRINVSTEGEASAERTGLESLDKGNLPTAIRLLETAAHMRRAPARAWYNLGIAYQKSARYKDAVAAYKHAADMPDSDNKMREAAQNLERWVSASGSRRIK